MGQNGQNYAHFGAKVGKTLEIRPLKTSTNGYIDAMTFYDNNQLITADTIGNLQVWNVKDLWRNNVLEFQHDQPAGMPGSVASGWTFASPTFSHDGQKLAIGGGNGNVEIINLLNGKRIFSYATDDMTLSYELKFSPDGRWLAFTGLFCQGGDCPNGVKIWDSKSSTVFLIDQMIPTYSAKIAFSPDSKFLAVSWSGLSQSDTVHIWDTSKWEIVKELKFDVMNSSFTNIAFSPSGNHLLLGISIADGGFLILDTQNWKKILEIQEASGSFTFNDSGNLLAISFFNTAISNGTIRILETNSWKEILSIKHDSQIDNVAFSYSGQYIAAIDYNENLIAWDTQSGSVISSKYFPGSQGSLISISDHPSWFLLHENSDIVVFDVFTGTEIERINTGEYVGTLDISPDGKYFVSGGGDGKVQVWLWRPSDLIAEACSRLSRNLTITEWQQYLGTEQYRATCPNLPIEPESTATATP